MQASGAQEQSIWEGSPSQWLNFKTYLVSALLVLAIVVGELYLGTDNTPELRDMKGQLQLGVGLLLLIPIFLVLRDTLLTKFTRYTLTSERIRITRGVFSRRTDDMELYRVDDIIITEPFFLRMVHRGNLILMTSDRTTPQLLIEAIPQVGPLRDQLRVAIEKCRDRKKTRVLDFE